MLILCVVCFLMPFAGRGARMAVDSMKNNVADWLPNAYEETKDLAEFRKYFVGDQFVVVSGPWCREGNSVFSNFVRKLREESLEYEEVLRHQRREEELLAHQKGDELGLMYTGDYKENWGEKRERWLQGNGGQWYFINRKGHLHRWNGKNNILDGARLWLEQQSNNGRNIADGKFLGSFGKLPDDAIGVPNEFYADPQKLCARAFKSITTGPDIFEKMAGENGTRNIGLFDEDDKTAFETRIKTHQLLTGNLFGPTPEPTFRWTYESLLHHVDDQLLAQLKSSEIFKERFEKFLEVELKEQFDDNFDKLRRSSPDKKLELWYQMWQAIELDPPPRQTCIIVTFNKDAINEFGRVVGRPLLGKPRGRILELATGECGISPGNLHIGGPPADNVAIDEEGTITLLRLVNLSMLLGIGLAYASFRSIRLTFMVFFVGGMSAIASLAYVWFGGSTLDAILMSMPSLVYVLGLSGAVHVVNYYRDACHETGPETAAEVAVKQGWFPCLLAAFTTAIGLISLYTSNLVPIQKFGLFSAIAVVGTVGILFTYLPSALTIWPPGYLRRKGDEKVPSKLNDFVTSTWLSIGEWVVRNHAMVVISSLVLMGVFAYGITKVNTSVHLLKLFDNQAKILSDYRWLEERLGKLVPMEIVINVDKGSQKEQWLEQQQAEQELSNKSKIADSDADPDSDIQPEFTYDKLQYDLKYSMLERMELSQRVRTNLEKFFGPTGLDIVGPGMSTDIFAPIESLDQLDPGTSIEAIATPRKIAEKQVAEKRAEMVEEDYLAEATAAKAGTDPAIADHENAIAGREMWRISLRLAALNDVDYGDFVVNLKTVVEPIMKAYEFRTKILKSLQQQLAEASLIKGKVLVLGRSPDRIAAENPQRMTSLANVMESVDQTFIFSDTLRDLLENRGFSSRSNKKKFKPPYKEKRYLWVDPNVVDVKKQTKDTFANLIRSYDCVVLIEDDPLFDVELIKQEASSFIDCRDHFFKIDPKTNKPLPGYLTAMQRIKSNEDLEIGTIYTGIIPIVYKAQNQLLRSLTHSIALAFVLIAFVMMVLLRNWRQPLTPGNALNVSGGIVSMIPNVFPIVIVFGAMGWLDIAVDIGSMMTASVAMGVAVDDTIHFLNWYRKALAMGQDRLEAIRTAYRRVATAMTQTTLIGGFGLSAFALSTFTPTQRFGTLMLIMLAVALIGDLILLPAILASPLGKFFGKTQNVDPGEDQSEKAIRIAPEFEGPDDQQHDSSGDLPEIHPDSLRHVKRQHQDGSAG